MNHGQHDYPQPQSSIYLQTKHFFVFITGNETLSLCSGICQEMDGKCMHHHFSSPSLTCTGCRTKQASSAHMFMVRKGVNNSRRRFGGDKEHTADGVALRAFCHGISFVDILPYLKRLPICMPWFVQHPISI
jgi:hypothetical protein